MRSSGYWSQVTRQAWREALEQMRWTTPLKVFQTLTPTAASGAVTWAMTRTPAYAAAASMVALVLVFGIWIIFRMVRIPPELAREAEAEQSRLRTVLESYSPAEADETLDAAVGYILTGEWTSQYPADLSQVGTALKQLREKAFRQKIDIWGRRSDFTIRRPIEPNFWEDHGVDIGAFFDAGTPVRTDKCRTATPTYRYSHLEVVRRQVEREWPREE